MSIATDLEARHQGDAVPFTVTVYAPGATTVTAEDLSAWTFQFWAAKLGPTGRGQSSAVNKTTGFTIDNTAKTVTFTVSAAETDALQVGVNSWFFRRTNSGSEATLAYGSWPIKSSRTP